MLESPLTTVMEVCNAYWFGKLPGAQAHRHCPADDRKPDGRGVTDDGAGRRGRPGGGAGHGPAVAGRAGVDLGQPGRLAVGPPVRIVWVARWGRDRAGERRAA